ncbi:MAG: DUF2752 domain-containing protein [Bacteroidales bacterium]
MKIDWLSDKKKLIIYLILYIGIAIIILLIPREWMLNADESICLSRRLFNIKCYGCGMTRATLAFIHCDFESAWNYNNRVFIIVPLLLYLYLKQLIKLIGKIRLTYNQ